MTELYGALQVPPAPPGDPSRRAAGDPFLDTLVSFLQASLNADLKDLWACIHPAVVKPFAEPVPVAFAFTHDPDEASFSENQLPAIYAWRAEEPRHVDWSQEWSKAVSNITLLWIPPLAQDEHRRIRQPFRNAFAKALHKNLYFGRNPAWIVDGDIEAKAADYGSLFILQAKVMQYWLRGVQPFKLPIEYVSHHVDHYECIMATIEVHEVLGSLLDDVAGIVDVRGTVSVGKDANGLNALPILSYEFAPSVTSCTPSAGAVAGNVAVTIRGKQFYRLDAFGKNTTDATLLRCTDATIAMTDGTPLLSVTFVDEGTYTAIMPAHAAGPVGLVLTMPSGTTFTLPNAFTYS